VSSSTKYGRSGVTARHRVGASQEQIKESTLWRARELWTPFLFTAKHVKAGSMVPCV
jgi:hypothetical protein